PASIDALAARTLIKGEPLAAPGGRADDASWPRREVGKVDPKDAKEEPAIAAGTPADGTGQGTAAAQPPKPVKRRPRPPAVMNTEGGNGFPGFFNPQPQQPAQPQ